MTRIKQGKTWSGRFNWRMIAYFILAFSLNTASFLELSKYGIRPDFIASLVFALGLYQPGPQALWFSLFAGLALDYLAAPAIGVASLPLIVVYIVASTQILPEGKLIFNFLQFILAQVLAGMVLSFTASLAAWRWTLANPLADYLVYHLRNMIQALPLDLVALAFWLGLFHLADYHKSQELRKDRGRPGGLLGQ